MKGIRLSDLREHEFIGNTVINNVMKDAFLSTKYEA